MSEPVTLRTVGDIAVLTIDNPPVNALSRQVVEGLVAQLERFMSDESAIGLVVCAAGRTFVAGGDIAEAVECRIDPQRRTSSLYVELPPATRTVPFRRIIA